LDQLTKAVLNKNEVYQGEHANDHKEAQSQSQKEEPSKPVDYPVYKYPQDEAQPTFTPAPEPKKEEKPAPAAETKKEEKPADSKKSDSEPFVGQKEAKQASFENFKFAVDHDPKEEYIAKTEFLQHDSIMDTVAHRKEIEAKKKQQQNNGEPQHKLSDEQIKEDK